MNEIIYSNILLNEWQKFQNKNISRQKGIEILEKNCINGFHIIGKKDFECKEETLSSKSSVLEED